MKHPASLSLGWFLALIALPIVGRDPKFNSKTNSVMRRARALVPALCGRKSPTSASKFINAHSRLCAWALSKLVGQRLFPPQEKKFREGRKGALPRLTSQG